ncbi:MAG: hypothetical protein KA941_09190 [Flavobacteriales bacterium]|nr:hypothetical protein [Flavobacteriales bacterium]
MNLNVLIPSLVLMVGITACGNADNKDTTTDNANNATTMVDGKSVVVVNDEAIVRRSTQMDGMANCIRVGTADTWKQLSLTSDQIRWMEELQGRMRTRNEQASASVNKDVNETTTYTFSSSDRRKLAEILTDEQMTEWMAMCPHHGVVVAN